MSSVRTISRPAFGAEVNTEFVPLSFITTRLLLLYFLSNHLETIVLNQYLNIQ
jgi:hypothetical protein